MPDVWDDRKKALEEEYFRKKDQEALEKLRAKRGAAEAESSLPRCPKCEGRLIEVSHEGIQIDRCNMCHGIWLDAGELESLTKHEEGSVGWLGRLWRS
ncbi:MAG TPA: zf-TFIIB domain-containing protein [Blastocatellia bacterium]|jgi:hypothetical protein|nr:zf-TFIIB domain-containing protein [Blastocatellia bacterium]